MTRDDIEKLLESLDSKATDINNYEYGLPLHNDTEKESLCLIVLDWLAETKNLSFYSGNKK